MNWLGRPELLAWAYTGIAPNMTILAQPAVARGRLKRAPDDRQALRLLARATARLGRDGQANALFARLGSSALQPEDLFLLGLGLNRGGQKESAERVWEKGLVLEPNHAEMIEQLISNLRSAESSGRGCPARRAVGLAAGLGASRRTLPEHFPR